MSIIQLLNKKAQTTYSNNNMDDSQKPFVEKKKTQRVCNA